MRALRKRLALARVDSRRFDAKEHHEADLKRNNIRVSLCDKHTLGTIQLAFVIFSVTVFHRTVDRTML